MYQGDLEVYQKEIIMANILGLNTGVKIRNKSIPQNTSPNF